MRWKKIVWCKLVYFFEIGSHPLGWPAIHYIAQAGPKLMVILLPQPPKCCDYGLGKQNYKILLSLFIYLSLLYLFIHVRIFYISVSAHVLQHLHGDKKTTSMNWFSLSAVWSGERTQVLGLGRKQLSLLSHLDSPGNAFNQYSLTLLTVICF